MIAAQDKFGVLSVSEFGKLITLLLDQGYEVIGPIMRDGAVVLDRIESIEDLPVGLTDEQQPGHYRLEPSESGAFFDYAVGPQSWKKYLHPADIRLWSAQRENGVFHILQEESKPRKRYAFFGARACDLAAIRVLDRVLFADAQQYPTYDAQQDPIYAERREGIFVVAVQCTRSAATCFCASLGTGPQVKAGYDIALTELFESGEHGFLVEAASETGGALLAQLDRQPVRENERDLAQKAVRNAADSQVRRLDTRGIRDLLYTNFDHPQWDNVAERCLTCANCTSVCPTCFCTTVEDSSDLSGDHAERWRRQDSCFTLDFSHIHGGNVRSSAKSRYRQWMTHKLASWIDQFGSLGCVGCGRCIAWCPVGIDITQEVQAIRGGTAHANA